jgi:hypothetical protein
VSFGGFLSSSSHGVGFFDVSLEFRAIVTTMTRVFQITDRTDVAGAGVLVVSGGGLVTRGANGVYTVVGIVSGGRETEFFAFSTECVQVEASHVAGPGRCILILRRPCLFCSSMYSMSRRSSVAICGLDSSGSSSM